MNVGVMACGGGHMCSSMQGEVSGDNCVELVLFLRLCLASGNHTWDIRLEWRVLHPLSDLASPAGISFDNTEGLQDRPLAQGSQEAP